MSVSKQEKMFNDAIKNSLRLQWTIRHGLGPPLDMIKKNQRYILLFEIENSSNLLFEDVHLRLFPAKSQYFGDHITFYSSNAYTKKIPSKVFRIKVIGTKKKTKPRLAYFRANATLKRTSLHVGIFRRTITATVRPIGTYTTTERF